MKFIIACAGTAGHINPALATAGELKRLMPDAEFLFVGAGRELEKKLITGAGYRLENVTITGFARGKSPKALIANIKTAGNLVISSIQCGKLIKQFKPDAVIGTGGYVCYPVLKQAAKRGIPTVMHESNAMPGLTTRMLCDRVDKMLVAFPDVKKHYKRQDNIEVTGTPVRQSFSAMTKEQARAELGIDSRPLVVSFWGSLGASVMNGYMADFIAKNAKTGAFNHIHATGGGEEGCKKLMDALKERGVTQLPKNIDIRPYIDNMGVVMTASDLVMCRAGASTIAELTMMGKPSILVPSPNVTDNHQEKNARAVENAGGARMILERDCDGDTLYNAAAELTGDSEKLSSMSAGAKALGVPDSASRIADIILSLIH